MDTPVSQRNIIHSLFEITILMKGIFGFLDIVIGTSFLFANIENIHLAMGALTGEYVIRHSSHAVNYLNHQASSFSLNTKYFIAYYFLFYGAVNLFLVISLLKKKSWAYPTAITFFSIFIIYQFYRSFTHHSGLLFFLSIFDIFLVALTWLEYKNTASPAKS